MSDVSEVSCDLRTGAAAARMGSERTAGRQLKSPRLTQLLLMAAALWAAMYGRSAIGPLQEAMQSSLRFDDNQIALLQGMAMALPMALCSIPLGLLADRFSRARLLSLFIALIPLSCILTAASSQFITLFLARCLTGLSAAAALILSFSIIGDLYGPAERGRASTAMAMGEISGAPAAFALGGGLLMLFQSAAFVQLLPWQVEDWRGALMLTAGMLMPVVLLVLFLREPPRRERVVERPSIREVWAELWRYRGVALPILIARGMVWLADGAVFVWGAPSLSRRFQLAPDRIGAIMGVVLLVSGLLGPALGGPLADFCQRHGGARRTVMVLAVLALLSLPAALFNFMPTVTAAAVAMVVFLTLGFAIATAGVALSVVVIPGELRGVYLGVTFAVGALFFVGLAPLAVSALSIALGGPDMIGRALAFVCACASLLGAVVFALSARFFPDTSSAPLAAAKETS